MITHLALSPDAAAWQRWRPRAPAGEDARRVRVRGSHRPRARTARDRDGPTRVPACTAQPTTPDLPLPRPPRRVRQLAAWTRTRITPTTATRCHFLQPRRTTPCSASSGDTTGHLIRELTRHPRAPTPGSTPPRCTAADLADLDYAELEGHQTGHPWLVANKGRIGFSAADAARWAPEARRPHRLPWIAVAPRPRRLPRCRRRSATPDLLYARRARPPGTLDAFHRHHRRPGPRPRRLPAACPSTPGSGTRWSLPLFAPRDRRRIHHRRSPPTTTCGCPSSPSAPSSTPAAPTAAPSNCRCRSSTPWSGAACPPSAPSPPPPSPPGSSGLRDARPVPARRDPGDPARRGRLGHRRRTRCTTSCPTVPVPVPGAARLHLARAARPATSTRASAPGRWPRCCTPTRTAASFTAELVARSGLAPRVWLRHLFAALLPPLLHFLYRYGTVFSPHGENAIVVFDEHDIPVRLAVKDFVDDVNVSAEPLPEHDTMPDDVRAVLLTEEPGLPHPVHPLGALRRRLPLPRAALRGTTRRPGGRVLGTGARPRSSATRSASPSSRSGSSTFDLLTPRIERLCLNRNRLHLDGYRDRPRAPARRRPRHRAQPAPPAPRESGKRPALSVVPP